MDVLEAIRTRRSIRKYKTHPIDDRTLETILEAARQAPSWANTQCWRFIVVRDSQSKTALSETLNPTNGAKDSVRNAPSVIVACAETGRSGYTYEKDKPPLAATDKGDAWYMFDLGLAMETLVLAAQSLGLATVHVGRFDAVKVAEMLGVPAGFRVVELLPLGYPDQVRDARPRKPLNEIAFSEKFGVSWKPGA